MRLVENPQSGRANIVQSIVYAGFQVEDRGVALEVAGNLVRGRYYYRVQFDFDRFDNQACYAGIAFIELR
jgi:hypothetical protein